MRILSVLVLSALLTACGSSSPSTSAGGGAPEGDQASSAPVGFANTTPIEVKLLSSGAINQPLISVTVCVPNTNNCQTINNILLDTGSYGLRLFSHALSSSVALPAETNSQGHPFWECAVFRSGYAWGSVVTADVHMGRETGAATPVQLIDASNENLPAGCSAGGTALSLDTNGVLGVGVLAQDCGTFCAADFDSGQYYSCSSGSGCEEVTVDLDQQVVNPVSKFAADNNGVIVELPAVDSNGSATITGTLVFGIGTQSNNQLGSATVLTADPNTGYLWTYLNGNTVPSVLDTGSNFSAFADNEIAQCANSSLFCPGTPVQLAATNYGMNQVGSAVTINVGNAVALSSRGSAALDNVAGSGSVYFVDFGLPFFYGRNVYLAINGFATSAGPGPYYAY